MAGDSVGRRRVFGENLAEWNGDSVLVCFWPSASPPADFSEEADQPHLYGS
jgi:hypothetical protein